MYTALQRLNVCDYKSPTVAAIGRDTACSFSGLKIDVLSVQRPLPSFEKEVVSAVAVVSRCGLAVRRLAGKQRDLGSIRLAGKLKNLDYLFSSLQNLWFMDTVL